jgi:PII-like signaling protein
MPKISFQVYLAALCKAEESPCYTASVDATADFREGKLLRIFVDEKDRAGAQPLYTAVVELLRQKGVAGATVFRGIEGFGSHHQIHVAKVFSWLPNLPIVIEVVDEWSVIEPLLPELQALIGDGLLTVEAAQYLRLSS